MFEGDLEFVLEEDDKIQTPANIYSIIRTLQFVEWAYNFSQIDKEMHIKESNKLLEKYKLSVDAYPEFKGLDQFVNEYKLQDCVYAINRIKQGNVQLDNKPVLKDVQNMTQAFNDLNIFLEQEAPAIVDLMQALNDLRVSFNNLKNCININHPDIKALLDYYIKLKNTPSTSSNLDENEVPNLKRMVQNANTSASEMLSKAQ